MNKQEIELPGGERVEIHLMGPDDRAAVLKFARAMPEKDLQFLRIDLTNESVVDEWLSNIGKKLSHSIVAYDDDGLVGYSSVHQNATPWTRHLGEIRVNVNAAYRSKGLGKVLVSRAFETARELGLLKLTGRMTSNQTSAQLAFGRLGFVTEAVLADYVIDKEGNTQDMIIMSFDVGGHSDVAAEPLRT